MPSWTSMATASSVSRIPGPVGLPGSSGSSPSSCMDDAVIPVSEITSLGLRGLRLFRMPTWTSTLRPGSSVSQIPGPTLAGSAGVDAVMDATRCRLPLLSPLNTTGRRSLCKRTNWALATSPSRRAFTVRSSVPCWAAVGGSTSAWGSCEAIRRASPGPQTLKLITRSSAAMGSSTSPPLRGGPG